MTPEVRASRAAVGNSGAPVLRLAVWEGPLDLLLELARAQRVDLARFSVTDLAGQFAAVLEDAIARRVVPLSRLAEWSVMAAWLLALHAHLLLPASTTESIEAEREMEDLRRRPAKHLELRLSSAVRVWLGTPAELSAEIDRGKRTLE